MLDFEEEAYVVPGMKVPILLGEDFQKNYNISVHRYEGGVHLSLPAGGASHKISAFNEPQVNKGFEVFKVETERKEPKGNPGPRTHQSPKDVPRTGMPRSPRPEEQSEYVRAMEDSWIQADSSKRIRVEGEFSGREVGLIERWMMSVKEGFYGGGSSLVRAEDPFVHVTNVTSTRIRVWQGDIMGVLRDPEMYLDKSSQECETQQKAFMLLAQSLPGDRRPKRKSCPNLSYPRINRMKKELPRMPTAKEDPKLRKPQLRKPSRPLGWRNSSTSRLTLPKRFGRRPST